MQSPFVPLPELIEIFKQAGFTERDLDLSAKPGMIEKTMKRAYLDVAETNSGANVLENVKLDIPARFDKRKDFVELTFDMYYNPATDKLRVRGLLATMNPWEHKDKKGNEGSKIYIFADTRLLTHSKDVHQDLVNIRMKKVLDIYENIIRKPVTQHARQI